MDIEPIQNKIFVIRGYKVMLDFHLAEIYEVETRRLKEQVRRNMERFPSDFMFQLTKIEWSEVIANCDNLPENIKYSPTTPFAFTQEGVAMLSGVLRTPVAIQTNISIMRAFVAVRNLILNPPISEEKQLQNEIRALKAYVEDIFKDQNDINEDTCMQLELINEALAELQSQKQTTNSPRRRIGYRTNDEDEFI